LAFSFETSPRKREEKWVIHDLVVHDTEHSVYIQLPKHIVDRQLVVNHCGADFPSILCHSQSRPGFRCAEHWHDELKKADSDPRRWPTLLAAQRHVPIMKSASTGSSESNSSSAH
jgi:hypothetical protein